MTDDRYDRYFITFYAYCGYIIYMRGCVCAVRVSFMFLSVISVICHCRMPCFKERKCKDTTFFGEIQINSWFFVVLSLIYRIFAGKIINKSIMAENEQNKQGLQLELPQEVAQGEYANFAIITHSSSDFVVDFARVLPGVPKAQVRSRVILAPEHAKRLLAALQENIMRYEKEYGQIRIPSQEPRTIAPFDLSKGEA